MYELHVVAQNVDAKYRATLVWDEVVEVAALDENEVVAVFTGCIEKNGRAQQYKVYGLYPDKPTVAMLVKDTTL